MLALGFMLLPVVCQTVSDDPSREPPSFARHKAKADITVIEEAVILFAINHEGRYPESLEDLLIPTLRVPYTELPWRGLPRDTVPYLDSESIPLDPWRRPYGYEPPEAGGRQFRVFSLGTDGKPGGDGEDQDIDNLLVQGKI